MQPAANTRARELAAQHHVDQKAKYEAAMKQFKMKRFDNVEARTNTHNSFRNSLNQPMVKALVNKENEPVPED